MSNAFARRHGLNPKDTSALNLQKIAIQVSSSGALFVELRCLSGSCVLSKGFAARNNLCPLGQLACFGQVAPGRLKSRQELRRLEVAYEMLTSRGISCLAA